MSLLYTKYHIIHPPPVHSYTHLMAFVDAQFPPLHHLDGELATDYEEPPSSKLSEDFTTFNYWREPVLADLPLELPDSDTTTS